MFDKAIDDNFVDTKENDHEKDKDSGKPLEHKYVLKEKEKNHSEEQDKRDNSNNNKHDKKTVITTELITVIEIRHPLIQKRLFLFWVIVWSRKLIVLTLQNTLNTSF